jgi:hypothetical protein
MILALALQLVVGLPYTNTERGQSETWRRR